MLRPGNPPSAGSPLTGEGPHRAPERPGRPRHSAHDGPGDRKERGERVHGEEGWPRPGAEPAARRPDAAERLRTLLEGNASAAVAIPGASGTEPPEPGRGAPAARAVAPEGDVVLLAPAVCPAAQAAARARNDGLAAVVEVADVAPAAVPHRIRGHGQVAGRLTAVRESAERAACARLLAGRHPAGPVPGPAWTLLRLEVAEGRVADLWGEEDVEPDALAAALPDPLAEHETELLQHLAAAHSDRMRDLCALLDGRAPAAAGRAAPLALDRFGLRVRFGTPEHCFDARFDFPEPVRDVRGLRRALHALFEAAGR